MKYYTYSLGCKVNSYENAAICVLFEQKGYIFDKNEPDVVLINTCSVTHVADHKSRQHIRKMRKLFPSAILVVMGCYSQGNGEASKSLCNADIVLGTNNRLKIFKYIDEFLATHNPIIDIDNSPRKFTYEELGVTNFSEHARAYIKIQDGCDNFCSYCIIPYRRGKSRSRKMSNIINEATELVNNGYKELIITGINVGMYGKDIGSTFTELVKQLVNIKGLYRIRISSIELSEIDDELIELMKNNEKLAKHFHIPLQSGSDHILKLMARKYDRGEFIKKLKKIRETISDICLTTDVIVGFPNETEEDFIDTKNLIEEVEFNMLHVFPYSPREGTPAASMKNQINDAIKNSRVDTLINLSNTLWNKYCSRFLNQTLDFLVERYDSVHKVSIARSSNYLLTSIPNKELKPGDIVPICYNEILSNKNE